MKLTGTVALIHFITSRCVPGKQKSKRKIIVVIIVIIRGHANRRWCSGLINQLVTIISSRLIVHNFVLFLLLSWATVPRALFPLSFLLLYFKLFSFHYLHNVWWLSFSYGFKFLSSLFVILAVLATLLWRDLCCPWWSLHRPLQCPWLAFPE